MPSDLIIISVAVCGVDRPRSSWTGGMMLRPDEAGTRSWTAANTTSVTAMAGSVLRMSTPAVTPSAKAKAA